MSDVSNDGKATHGVATIDRNTPVLEIPPREIQKNRAMSKREDTATITVRMGYLERVENELKKTLQRPPSRREILDQMSLLGFDIGETTLWRDRGRIKTRQEWLSGLLSEGTYSAYQADTMELLDYIKEKAIQFLNINWTGSKQVIKGSPKAAGKGSKEMGNVESMEQTVTMELATPKYNFLNILCTVSKLRSEFINGENIELATAMLEEEFQRMKIQNEDLIMKNKLLEEELKHKIRGPIGKGSSPKKG